MYTNHGPPQFEYNKSLMPYIGLSSQLASTETCDNVLQTRFPKTYADFILDVSHSKKQSGTSLTAKLRLNYPVMNCNYNKLDIHLCSAIYPIKNHDLSFILQKGGIIKTSNFLMIYIYMHKQF